MPESGPLGGIRSMTEVVLACVAAIPPGKVMTYGDIAEYTGSGAARQVGRIMATEGMDVPWYRVVRSDGSCAEHIRAEQLMLLRVDGVPMLGDRVDLARARWDGRLTE